MQSPMALLAAFAILVAGLPAAATERVEVTPVQKVIALLKDMVEKGRTEKHNEQTQYAAFSQFCDDTSAVKKQAIQEGMRSIEIHKANTEKLTVSIAADVKAIGGHTGDIDTWEGEVKEATTDRNTEHNDFTKTHTDYSESIDALGRAITVLRKEMHDRTQASTESLTQVGLLRDLALIPAYAKGAIGAFLAEDPTDGLDYTAPESNGYEFHSSNIVDILEKLLDKFTQQRTKLEREEANSRNTYDALLQSLQAQIKRATSETTRLTVLKAKHENEKATAEGDLAVANETLEADQTYLADLTATCDQKASEFEARQQLRTEELEVIEKAIEIISSARVEGQADKHLPALTQKRRTLLARTRAGVHTANQEQAANFLRFQARKVGSHVLSQLAERVAEDPFNKVKKMIADLLNRLMEEANNEAAHKGWCDTELATNEQTRKEKTQAVESLRAEVEELETNIAKAKETIAELSAAIASIDEAVRQATEMRAEESRENEVTVKDAQKAQEAVAQAVSVLQEFYAKAGQATVLVQQVPPPIWDTPYTGRQAEGGGVLGLLEVIASDFLRLETETEKAEAAAKAEYDKFMHDSEVNKAQHTKDVEHTTSSNTDMEASVKEKSEDLRETEVALAAALEYYEKLKPSCVTAGVSYDDRVARRRAEIESLQEALRILNGKELA